MTGLLTGPLSFTWTALAQETVGPPGPLVVGPLYETVRSGPPQQTVFRFVEGASIGPTWPLVVDTAYVGCARNQPRVSVLLVIDGQPWTLNAESAGWFTANPAELEVGGSRKSIKISRVSEPWMAGDPEFDPSSTKSLAPLILIAKRLGCLPKSAPSPVELQGGSGAH